MTTVKATLKNKRALLTKSRIEFLFDHILDGFKSSHEGAKYVREEGIINDVEYHEILEKNAERLVQRIHEFKIEHKLLSVFFALMFAWMQVSGDDLQIRRPSRTRPSSARTARARTGRTGRKGKNDVELLELFSMNEYDYIRIKKIWQEMADQISVSRFQLPYERFSTEQIHHMFNVRMSTILPSNCKAIVYDIATHEEMEVATGDVCHCIQLGNHLIVSPQLYKELMDSIPIK